jgi:uncharacterized RmlC-like cupin family protein
MDWKENGVKIVRAGELDTNTPQTSGMTRAAAITHARTGANKLWAGNVPPYVPHQEINASANEVCEAVVIRNGQADCRELGVNTPEPASEGHPGMPFHPHG